MNILIDILSKVSFKNLQIKRYDPRDWQIIPLGSYLN